MRGWLIVLLLAWCGLAQASLPLGENVGYTYVQNGCGCSGVGRPQSLTFHAVDYTSAINYTYDSSLVTGVAWSGPVAGTVNAGYDNFFRVNALSVNGGNPVGFGYDADGLLVQAGDLALTRDAQNGWLTGTTLGNVSDAWTYNSFGEAQSYTAAAGGNVLYAMSFTRDSAGRITTRTEMIGGVTSVCGYGYDPVRGWLTDVTKNGVAAGHYAYDDNGNRTSVVTLDREVNYAAADGQDRITGAILTLPLQAPQNVSWTYSANGEVQSRTVGGLTTSYSYDVLGNLRDVTLTNGVRIEYVVDAAGRRIGKAVNGSLTQGWLYQDGLKPAAELDGAGNVVSLFVYGGKANVPEYLVRGGNEYRLITDPLGSVRLVVNAADGTVAQELDYDESGRVLNDSNPGFQPFGFAGGLYDPHTKLVRFGARDYDAASGRWMSKDLIGFGGGNNWYAYVGNNPINNVDPFGLAPGDNYGSMVEAGVAAIQWINATSIIENREYAGWIYLKKDGYYSFTKPRRGSKDRSCPGWWGRLTLHTVADYHTHGANDPEYDNENFSPTDIKGNDSLGKPGFLGTPGNSIQVYAPGSGVTILGATANDAVPVQPIYGPPWALSPDNPASINNPDNPSFWGQ